MLKLATTLCLLSGSLAAQWPKPPAFGVPQTKDGKPDLSAPAPRSADGKPDLSGVWMVANPGSLFYFSGDLKPGEMQPWAAARLKQSEENFRNNTDGINCLPPGPKAGIGVGNLPFRIVQTPGLIAMLYEYQTIYRQIFTNGRALPKDPNPTWMGYSTGTWNGDTLVVTTIGYNDRTSLDLGGSSPYRSVAHDGALSSRRLRPNRSPGDVRRSESVHAARGRVSAKLDSMPDGDLIEYVCENERDKPHPDREERRGISRSRGGSCSICRDIRNRARPRDCLAGRRPPDDRHGVGKERSWLIPKATSQCKVPTWIS